MIVFRLERERERERQTASQSSEDEEIILIGSDRKQGLPPQGFLKKIGFYPSQSFLFVWSGKILLRFDCGKFGQKFSCLEKEQDSTRR